MRERMSNALQKLSEAHEVKDAMIANRDPMSPLSFCILPPDIIHKQAEELAAFLQGLNSTLSPLDDQGRPIRKYVYLLR